MNSRTQSNSSPKRSRAIALSSTAAALVVAATAAPAAGGVSPALANDHAPKVLYTFAGGSDGANPDATPIRDKAGNLYGTTYNGCGDGTVFRLAPDGTETVLHCFAGGTDGAQPRGGLTADKSGTLYGTTQSGGIDSAGIVFDLASDGTETVLYAFTGGNDGGTPLAAPVKYKTDLYGTTEGGGASDWGTVFKLAPDGTETVLYSFTGGSDGGQPYAGLTMDKTGNLYGTTDGGGTSDNGVVFKIARKGKETVLHSFAGGNDGAEPSQFPMILGTTGDLYGMTQYGGAGRHRNGAIFLHRPGRWP